MHADVQKCIALTPIGYLFVINRSLIVTLLQCLQRLSYIQKILIVDRGPSRLLCSFRL
jgi:hypothetical protein